MARYELAHLYDLTGHHFRALALHANNREQYPRFYRGRYRLAMSLEMIASLDPKKRMSEKERDAFDAALRILRRWDGKRADKNETYHVEDDKLVLSTDLRSYLLEAAQKELQEIGQYLTLRDVIWQSLWHRNERGVLKPYWRLRHRQSFHDGVCLAQLLVAVRQTLNEKEADPLRHGLTELLPAVRQTLNDDPRPRGPVRLLMAVRQNLKADPLPHPQKVLRIATAIADDSSYIAELLGIPVQAGQAVETGASAADGQAAAHPPRPRQYSTPSWPAAYNLACIYAAICAYLTRQPHAQIEDNQAQDDAEN